MERRKEEQIGDVIYRFFRQSQLETPLNEYRLIHLWGEVAGPTVERMTKDLRIFNQVLHVSLRSSVMRSELSLRRSELVRKLNEKVGATVINDIAFSWNSSWITIEDSSGIALIFVNAAWAIFFILNNGYLEVTILLLSALLQTLGFCLNFAV